MGVAKVKRNTAGSVNGGYRVWHQGRTHPFSIEPRVSSHAANTSRKYLYPFTYVILPTQLTFTPLTQAPQQVPPHPFSSSLPSHNSSTTRLPTRSRTEKQRWCLQRRCKLLVTVARRYGDRIWMSAGLQVVEISRRWKMAGCEGVGLGGWFGGWRGREF